MVLLFFNQFAGFPEIVKVEKGLAIEVMYCMSFVVLDQLLQNSDILSILQTKMVQTFKINGGTAFITSDCFSVKEIVHLRSC